MRPLLDVGFKPLFLCTSLSALVLMASWGAYISGVWPNFSPTVSPMLWHGHEMLFGFVGSAIGGFLLTAVATWTKRPLVSGSLLGLIVVSWIAGRFVMAFDSGIGLHIRIAIDASYFLLLSLTMGREIVLSKNYRNLPVIVILVGFFVLSLLFHSYPIEVLRACLALVCLLVSFIAGRIIPAFTTNWLRVNKPGTGSLPTSFNRFDLVVVSLSIPTLFIWALYPTNSLIGWPLIVIAVLHGFRLLRWQGHRTFSEPLLFALHAGYFWLPVGFAFLGVASLGGNLSISAGIHTLGIGAIASMILAVATRAAKGHSGVPVISDPIFSLIFVLIHLVVIFRLVSTLNPALLVWTVGLWLVCFLLFATFVIKTAFFPGAGDVELNQIK